MMFWRRQIDYEIYKEIAAAQLTITTKGAQQVGERGKGGQ